ncbi:uncharacterized protein V1518DRAFT_417392 [Limtongia smithiae]|uniref:uncharacterized protein n=1 Tax=Limtongia smithiae TaxID=1125753 RepID=UPI0034CD5D27
MFAATPPGFKNAPITKLYIIFTIGSSIITSIAGLKHYVILQLVPHIWGWGQWWRLIVWPFVYLNESEVLFASLLMYNLRVIERMLGSRKYASLLLLSYVFTLFLAPLLLIILKLVPSYSANYLPPGTTPIIFTVLALYHDMIPSVYKFKISPAPVSDIDPPPNTSRGFGSFSASTIANYSITLSDKIFVYVLASHLAFAQAPGSMICAVTGWYVGMLWTREVLPFRSWRIPQAWWDGTQQRSRAGMAVLGTTTQQQQQSPVVAAAARLNGAVAAAEAGNGGNGSRADAAAADGPNQRPGGGLLDTFRANF